MTILYLILIVSSALLLGNEFSVAAFIHPSLARADHKRFLPAIQVFAALFGTIMPVWMGLATGLHILLTVLTWNGDPTANQYMCAATLLWIVIIVFSVLLPVPINNRVKIWKMDSLPEDWLAQRWRWDFYNWIRVVLIMAAFLFLVLSYKHFPG